MIGEEVALTKINNWFDMKICKPKVCKKFSLNGQFNF